MKMRKSNRQSAFDIGFDVVSTLLLIIALLIVLYPLYFVLIAHNQGNTCTIWHIQ